MANALSTGRTSGLLTIQKIFLRYQRPSWGRSGAGLLTGREAFMRAAFGRIRWDAGICQWRSSGASGSTGGTNFPRPVIQIFPPCGLAPFVPRLSSARR